MSRRLQSPCGGEKGRRRRKAGELTASPGYFAGAVITSFGAAVVPVESNARQDKACHAIADCTEEAIDRPCSRTRK
jgi:hypothetical protein